MHYKMKPLCDYNSYFNWVTLTSMAKEYIKVLIGMNGIF